MIIRFSAIIITLLFVILLSEYTIYSVLHNAGLLSGVTDRKIFIYISTILPSIFVLSMFYSYKYYSLFNAYLNQISAIWLGVILYIFIASVIISVILLTNNYFGLQIPVKYIAKVIVIATFIIITYGILNSNNPRIVRWGIVSRQLSKDWSGKKIVVISDVHLGNIRREEFLKKVLYKIEREKPDVVFILGDLIDGSVFPYKKWLEQFSTISTEFGILYVEGNHEKYNQEYNKYISEIPESINNITNKKIVVNNTQIIGLDYHQNETGDSIHKELESLGYEKDKPSIVLMHDPKNSKYLADENVTLTMSGHTHGGQLFPFTFLVKKLYREYTHGVSYNKDTTSITTYGVGTAIIPMRIGTIPEILVLVVE
jgi:predicted MPP superfamily phosphohydrolase